MFPDASGQQNTQWRGELSVYCYLTEEASDAEFWSSGLPFRDVRSFHLRIRSWLSRFFPQNVINGHHGLRHIATDSLRDTDYRGKRRTKLCNNAE